MAKFLTLTEYSKGERKYYINVDHILSFNEGAATTIPNTEVTVLGGDTFYVAEPIIRIIRMINIANNEDTDE